MNATPLPTTPGPFSRSRTGRKNSRAFTLTEVLISTTILGMAMSMTMVVFIAAMKRAQHTDLGLKATAELRNSVDLISQNVRSASQLPTIEASGLKLIVPPKDLGVATVLETTWIDSVANIKGSKANQRMIKVSNAALPAVLIDFWKGAARPPGAISSGDLSTYFISASSLPATDLNELFATGDTIKIPATAYGAEVTGIINNISNNSGDKTLTLKSNLGVDVPNGTQIQAASGRRVMFEVVASGAAAGELRYYPDKRNLTNYTVLARDIDPSPLTDPSSATSPTTVPFAISSESDCMVVINLQKIPAGTSVGRTLQGVRTTVFTRTDPTSE